MTLSVGDTMEQNICQQLRNKAGRGRKGGDALGQPNAGRSSILRISLRPEGKPGSGYRLRFKLTPIYLALQKKKGHP